MLELSMGWISSISHWFYQLRLRKVVDRWFVFYCALFVVLFCEFLALFGSLPVVAEDRSVGIVDGENVLQYVYCCDMVEVFCLSPGPCGEYSVCFRLSTQASLIDLFPT